MRNIDCVSRKRENCGLGHDNCLGCKDYKPRAVEEALDEIAPLPWYFQEPHIREILSKYVGTIMVDKIMKDLESGK